MKTLPNKPSELLLLAMQDLELTEQMPETYVINMRCWHLPMENGCNVCLAGSVLAQSVGVSPDSYRGYPDTPTDLKWKMDAINSARSGSFLGFLLSLRVDMPSNLPIFYEDRIGVNTMDHLSIYNRKEWKLHMATIIGILQAEGL